MNRRTLLRAMLAPLAVPGAACRLASDELPRVTTEWPNPEDPNYWSWIRDQFLIPRDEVFFNTGTLGACPRQVIDTVTEHMRQIEQTLAHWDYKPDHPTWFSGYTPETGVREKLGKVIHAKTSEVALTQNATFGMNFVANGLTLQAGDQVLVTDQEHPGGICGWLLRGQRDGIEVRQLEIPIPPPDPETLVRIFAEAIGPRTRVIAVPHITSKYGIVMPVREICALARRHGLLTVIDGAQAVGQLHVNVKDIGCDAYFSSPHKWLLAPPGNGLLYIREPRIAEVWTTLASSEWNNYPVGAYRLMQYGTGNLSLLRGLEAAIEFHMRIGPDRVEKRIVGLANQLRGGLREIKRAKIYSPTHPALAGAMTTYGIEGVSGERIQDELWNRARIRVRSVGEGVRHSCHIYNSPEEIERTLRLLQQLAA